MRTCCDSSVVSVSGAGASKIDTGGNLPPILKAISSFVPPFEY
jgi:hypothetical protein